jgi:polyhydroxyalkanoate synthase
MTRKSYQPLTHNDFDREFRAQLAQMTSGLAPTAFASAFGDWAMHLAQAPAKQNELQQLALKQAQDTWTFALRALSGESLSPADGAGAPADRRFQADDWSRFPFNVYARAYQNNVALMKAAVTDVSGVSDYHEHLVEFALRMRRSSRSASRWPRRRARW